MSWVLKLLLLLTSVIPLTVSCPDACYCDGPHVNCTGKGLSSVPQGIPDDVETLTLAHNIIQNLDDNAFANFTQLKVLDLSNNVIEMIPQSALSGLIVLNYLDVSLNQIHDIDPDAFMELPEVTEINLSNNKLANMDTDLFLYCPFVSSVTLNSNRFDNQVFQSFSKSPSLQQLNTADNPLDNLPYKMLSVNTRLTFLQLRGANISEIDTSAFVGLSAISNLDLSHNLLTNLQRETFQSFAVVNTINLENNPLQCSCDVKKFQDWLNEQVDDNILVPDVFCSDPILGGDVNIESGDLDHLCYANATLSTPAPTFPPPGDCDRNAQLQLDVADGQSDDERLIIWSYDLIEDNNEIQLECRKFEEDPFMTVTVPVLDKSYSLSDLDLGENYVCCGLVYSCGVYSCTDFDTGLKDCANVGFIVGMTIIVVALVATLFCAIGLVIYFIRNGKCGDVCDSKDKGNISSDKIEANIPSSFYFQNSSLPPELPKPRPPPLRKESGAYYEINEPYEIIPADTMDPENKPAFSNPGYLKKTPSQREQEQADSKKHKDKPHRNRSNSEPAKPKKKHLQHLEPDRVSLGQYLHQSETDVRKPRRFTKPKPEEEVPSNGHVPIGAGANNTELVKQPAEQMVHSAEELAPPFDMLNLPPKNPMTRVNARIRAMQEGHTLPRHSSGHGTMI